MAVTGKPRTCPQCGSEQFREIGRVEAHEDDITPHDVAVHECNDCGAEFENKPPTTAEQSGSDHE